MNHTRRLALGFVEACGTAADRQRSRQSVFACEVCATSAPPTPILDHYDRHRPYYLARPATLERPPSPALRRHPITIIMYS
jgi:hypothetical protein